MGQLQVTVLNSLVCAPQCASTVSVVVFAHMENAQFAVPIQPTVLPFGLPALPASASAQVGGVEKRREVSEDHQVSRPLSVPPASLCTGEVSASIRQLLKRFMLIQAGTFDNKAATATVPGSSGNVYVLRPWRMCSVPTGTISDTAPDKVYTDYFSHFAPMYAFFRGSMRFKLVFTSFASSFAKDVPVTVAINNSTINKTATNPVSTDSKAVFAPIIDTTNTTAPKSKVYERNFGEAGIPIYLDKESAVEFEVPYYSTGHMVPTNYSADSLANHRISITPIPYVTVYHPQLKGSTYRLYRACGDDFSFGGLLGSPTVGEFNFFD